MARMKDIFTWFAARVAAGPKFSPLGPLATRVVTPRLPVEHRIVPGPPKRLAQGMGLAMSATASLLSYGVGAKRAAYRVLGGLVFAAALESAFGICLVCKLFPFLMRAGFISQTAGKECSHIWARQRSEAERA